MYNWFAESGMTTSLPYVGLYFEQPAYLRLGGRTYYYVPMVACVCNEVFICNELENFMAHFAIRPALKLNNCRAFRTWFYVRSRIVDFIETTNARKKMQDQNQH